MKILLSIVPVCALLVACSNTVSGDGASGGSGGASSTSGTTSMGSTSSTADAGSATSSTGGGCTLPPASFPATYPPPDCQVPEAGIKMPQNEDEIRSFLIGRWLSCGQSFIPGNMQEQGVEIACDGTWYKLVEATPGNLERATGFGNQGTWEIDMFGGSYPTMPQINFDIAGGGGIFEFPAFSTTPRKMSMIVGMSSTMAVYVYQP